MWMSSLGPYPQGKAATVILVYLQFVLYSRKGLGLASHREFANGGALLHTMARQVARLSVSLPRPLAPAALARIAGSY